MKREEKLVKNTAILTIGTVFSSLFSFFLVPVFSHWLSESEYGNYDLFLTYVTLLIPVVTLSCGEAAFRFLLDSKEEGEKRNILNCTWFIACIGTIVGIIAILVIFPILHLSCMFPFIALFISFMLYNQGNFIARGFRKLTIYTVSNILYLIMMAIFVTWFVFFEKKGLAGILYGNAIGHFIGFLYMFVRCRMWKYISFTLPKLTDIKKQIGYSAPLIPNSVSWWVVNVSDRTIITVVLGSALNGIYAIAYKLPSLCSTVFGVFHMSWLESAVDSLNDEDRNDYTNGVFNNIFPFCFSVATGVLACNRYFYKWIWDPKYANGHVFVWILLCGMCFSFLAQFLGGLLIAEKRTKANGTTTVVAAIINIIVHIALVKSIGLYAAAISTMVSYLSLFIIRMVMLNKAYQLKINYKSISSVVVFGLTAALQFIDSDIMGFALILCAAIYFVIINKKLIFSIAKKLLRRSV